MSLIPPLPRMSWFDANEVAPGVPRTILPPDLTDDRFDLRPVPQRLAREHKLMRGYILPWPSAPYPLTYVAQIGTERGTIVVVPNEDGMLEWDRFTANRAVGLAGMRQSIRQGFADTLAWIEGSKRELAGV